MSKRLLNIINKLELSNKDRADFYDELKNIVPTSKPIKTEPYSLLEYIEGTKGQVIKTDLIIDENDTIECDYEMTDFGLTVSGDKFIFNSYGNTNSYRVKFSTYSSNKKVYLRFGDSKDTTITNVLDEDTQKGTIMMKKGLCTINGVEIAQLPFVAMPDGPIQIFSKTGSYVKIFEFRIIRGDEVIHRLVPFIKNANKEVGFLDAVTSKFYINEEDVALLYKEIPVEPTIDNPTLDLLFPKEKFNESMFLTKTKDFLIKNGTNEYGETCTFALLSTTKNARGVGFEMKDGHRYKIKVANKCPDNTTWRVRIGVWEEAIDKINFVPAVDDALKNISYYKGTPAKEMIANEYQTISSFETIYENVNNYKTILMLLGWGVDYSYIDVSIEDLDENDLSEAVQITNDNISDSVRRKLLTPWNKLTKKPMTELDKLTLTNVLTSNMANHNKATQAIMELAYDFWKHRDEFMYCDKTPRDAPWDYWSTTGFVDVNTGSAVTEENAGFKRIDCSTFVYYVTSGIGYYSSPYYNTLENTTVEQGALTSAGVNTTSTDPTICRTGKMQIRTGKKLILESANSSKYTFRKIFGYDEKGNLVQTFSTVTIGTTLTPDPTVNYLRAELKVSAESDYIPTRGTADRAPAPILKRLRIRENEILPVKGLCPASERYAKAMCKWYDDNGYAIPYNRWHYSDNEFPVGSIMWWGRKTATSNYKYITHITLYIGGGYVMHASTGGMGLTGGQGIHISTLEELFDSYTEPLSGVASPEYHTNYDKEKELLGIA